MKASRCVWKVMMALFMAAMIPLLITGCLGKEETQSKSEPSAKKAESSIKESEHPEHPKKSSAKKPEHPEHPK